MTSYAKNLKFEGKALYLNTWQCDADYHSINTYNSNIFSHIHSLVVLIMFLTDGFTHFIQDADYQ